MRKKLKMDLVILDEQMGYHRGPEAIIKLGIGVLIAMV
jgi:hypothetical protein